MLWLCASQPLSKLYNWETDLWPGIYTRVDKSCCFDMWQRCTLHINGQANWHHCKPVIEIAIRACLYSNYYTQSCWVRNSHSFVPITVSWLLTELHSFGFLAQPDCNPLTLARAVAASELIVMMSLVVIICSLQTVLTFCVSHVNAQLSYNQKHFTFLFCVLLSVSH